MIEVHPQSHGNVIGFTIDGKLLKEDYKKVIPQLEDMIAKYGPIRCLIEITGMKGAELGAFWEEIKFDTKHYLKIQRCAIVGDSSWHHWMTNLSKLIFLKAKIQYFEPEDMDQAWEWLEQDMPASKEQAESQEEEPEPVGSSSSHDYKP